MVISMVQLDFAYRPKAVDLYHHLQARGHSPSTTRTRQNPTQEKPVQMVEQSEEIETDEDTLLLRMDRVSESHDDQGFSTDDTITVNRKKPSRPFHIGLGTASTAWLDELEPTAEDIIREKLNNLHFESSKTIDTNDLSRPTNIVHALKKQLALNMGSSIQGVFVDQNQLNIKLLFSEFDMSSTARSVGAWFTRRLSAEKFGNLHVRIAVGNTIIEWTPLSVIIPRPLRSNKCIKAVDLSSVDDTGEALNNISRIIDEYNVNHDFNIHKDNSETLIRAICEKLCVRLDFTLEGQMGKVISKIVAGEAFRATYTVPKEVSKELSTPSQVEFESHEQLDDFAAKLLTCEYYSTAAGKQDVSDCLCNADTYSCFFSKRMTEHFGCVI
jgi:hypothetical protein